jgi:hypothetical protein
LRLTTNSNLVGCSIGMNRRANLLLSVHKPRAAPNHVQVAIRLHPCGSIAWGPVVIFMPAQ